MGNGNHITQFVNEHCQLLAGRARTRAAELHAQAGPVLGRLHLDHGLTAKAETFTKLADQFTELAIVADSPELLVSLEPQFDEFEGLIRSAVTDVGRSGCDNRCSDSAVQDRAASGYNRIGG